MDEWISAADPTINETANRLQEKVAASASILVMASHSEGILRKWTDRLLWLNRGLLQADGPIGDVYDEYHAFIRGGGK